MVFTTNVDVKHVSNGKFGIENWKCTLVMPSYYHTVWEMVKYPSKVLCGELNTDSINGKNVKRLYKR